MSKTVAFKPDTTKLVLEAAKKMGDASKKVAVSIKLLEKGGFKRRTLRLLLADSTGLSMKVVEQVLTAMESLHEDHFHDMADKTGKVQSKTRKTSDKN